MPSAPATQFKKRGTTKGPSTEVRLDTQLLLPRSSSVLVLCFECTNGLGFLALYRRDCGDHWLSVNIEASGENNGWVGLILLGRKEG